MRTLTLHCPRCGRSITVSAAAPPRLTCPSCLAAIVNPGVPPELPGELQLQAPLPVLPLETEVRWDRIASRVAAAAVGMVLLTGVLMVAGSVRPGTWTGPLLVLLIIAALGGTVLAAALRPHGILNPHPKGTTAGAHFFAGLLGGIAACAAVLFGGQWLNLIWVVPVSGVALAILPSTRAVGAGILVSIGVSVLILFGLCFAALAGMH